MLLIIFLGLIAKLNSVSGDCDVGTQGVKINWNKFSDNRVWYYRMYTAGSIASSVGCFAKKYGSLEGNISPVTVWAYHISAQRPIKVYGNATNWNLTSWEEIYPQFPFWNGRNYAIAVDYDRYFIDQYCLYELKHVGIYVAYRVPFPDEDTVMAVKKVLEKNNIDHSQLLEWPAKKCNHSESSTIKDVAYRIMA